MAYWSYRHQPRFFFGTSLPNCSLVGAVCDPALGMSTRSAVTPRMRVYGSSHMIIAMSCILLSWWSSMWYSCAIQLSHMHTSAYCSHPPVVIATRDNLHKDCASSKLRDMWLVASCAAWVVHPWNSALGYDNECKLNAGHVCVNDRHIKIPSPGWGQRSKCKVQHYFRTRKISF